MNQNSFTDKSSPKNCMSFSFVPLVLLLRYARVSFVPWKMRAIKDIDMAVDPELYSTTVFFSSVMLSLNKFIAELISVFLVCRYTITTNLEVP